MKMNQLKEFWSTTTGKITILGGGGLVGVLSLCFFCTICSMIIGPLNDSRQVANVENQPTVQNGSTSLPTATPLPTEPILPTETPELTATPIPTATPEPTFTPDPCTVEIEQAGRDEPKYVGIEGYLAESYPSGDYDKALPSYLWDVPLLKQVGPDLWEESGETLPHKTPVIVLEQHLKHEGFGRYSGFLVVKSLEDSKEYRVDHYKFVPTD